jgi:hypothetical protein
MLTRWSASSTCRRQAWTPRCGVTGNATGRFAGFNPEFQASSWRLSPSHEGEKGGKRGERRRGEMEDFLKEIEQWTSVTVWSGASGGAPAASY